MSNIRDNIRKTLMGTDEVSKKSITVILEEDVITDLRTIGDKFNEINGSKVFTRNYLIENAVKTYIEECKDVLYQDYNINLDFDKNDEDNVEFDFDTVIFPAHNDGFKEVFLNENCWYSVRISEKKIDKLKYIAIYRSSPISGVTHFAEIDRIEQYKDTDKKIIYFKSQAQELENKIQLGELNANSMRSPRYTTIDKLVNSTELKELF